MCGYWYLRTLVHAISCDTIKSPSGWGSDFFLLRDLSAGDDHLRMVRDTL